MSVSLGTNHEPLNNFSIHSILAVYRMCGISLIVDKYREHFKDDWTCIKNRGPDHFDSCTVECDDGQSYSFQAGVLHIQGESLCKQPYTDECGNILLWNGELFNTDEDNVVVKNWLSECKESRGSDTAFVSKLLEGVSDPTEVSAILARLHGPFAFIYYHKKSQTIIYGRDPFGRRCLLLYRDSYDSDNVALLTSVAPQEKTPEPDFTIFEGLDQNQKNPNSLNCSEVSIEGIFVLSLESKKESCVPWPESRLRLARALIDKTYESEEEAASAAMKSAEDFLQELRNGILRRVSSLGRAPIDNDTARVGVLFSGGIDSVLLAALLHQCLEEEETIDLINVAFYGEAGNKVETPDRLSANSALIELQSLFPTRKFNYICVDVEPEERQTHEKHVHSLIYPSNTHMDLNIGLAFWFAARGRGVITSEGDPSVEIKCKCSTARALLVGIGADEQTAGYGRHRNTYLRGGIEALASELNMDMDRLWKRNLGRDDRCISDSGREAWFPFLDESVVGLLHSLPLREIADLREPPGFGDKFIIRQAARLVGLNSCTELVKRAVQFGTRIAKHTNALLGGNRKTKGTDVI